MTTTTTTTASRAWAIPRPVLATATALAIAMLVPIVIAFLVAGITAAMGIGMGYSGCIAAATRLSTRRALLLVPLAAMAGAVAVALNSDPFTAACFAALVCLLVAPANLLDNGLLAGLPTVAVVYLAIPVQPDPAEFAAWTAVGGLIGVLLVARLPRPAALGGIDAVTAYIHAGAMAAAVAISLFLVVALGVPHGYWIPMTLTVVLRPFRGETWPAARQRIAGSVGGALLAMIVALVVPAWAVLAAIAVMLALFLAYAALGRMGPAVTCMTAFVVLLSAGGAQEAAVGIAFERVAASVVGALVAAGVALVLVRVEASVRRPARA